MEVPIMAGWFEQMVASVEHAYERRLNRASGLTVQNAHSETIPEEEEEDEGEIVNLPRGVAVALPEKPDTPSE
jgi:hypothetical protein